jgi:hypothetical protein
LIPVVRCVRSSGFKPVVWALFFNMVKRQVYLKLLPIVNCKRTSLEGGNQDSGEGPNWGICSGMFWSVGLPKPGTLFENIPRAERRSTGRATPGLRAGLPDRANCP